MQASHATSSFFILGPTLLPAETYALRYAEVNARVWMILPVAV
jgi:hypothetical protein